MDCICLAGAAGPTGGPCTQCVAGTYQAAAGMPTCDACLAGSFSGAVGALSAATCEQCPADSYSPTDGAAACSDCPADSSALPGSASLVSCICLPGTWGPDGGACTLCPAGTHQGLAGSATCDACVAGTSSAAVGALSDATCADCLADTYAPTDGAASCLACPTAACSTGTSTDYDCAGFTAPAGSTACSPPDLPCSSFFSAGSSFSCARSTEGVKCWGEGKQGRLGNGLSSEGVSSPVDVLGLDMSAVAGVATGDDHACALMVTGSVKCWGRNQAGQLGNGDYAETNTAGDVLNLGGSAVAITAGWGLTCALMSTATIKCWGTNGHGKLGIGSDQADSSTPVEIPSLSGVLSVDCGTDHCCAVLDTTGGWCWGSGGQGRLGDGTDVGKNYPVQVVNDLNVDATFKMGFLTVSVGNSHTCAVFSDESVWCWGDGTSGKLGINNEDSKFEPQAVVGLGPGMVRSVSAARLWGHHSCAILKDQGKVTCWGANSEGQLGTGDTVWVWTPGQRWETPVTGISGAVAIQTSSTFSCAALDNTEIWCWGSNSDGRLGNGVDPIPTGSLGEGVAETTPVKVIGNFQTATCIPP